MTKILLVDDEPELVGIYQDIISEKLNADFTYAHNGREAIQALQENAVDLIISDINMPVMDGLEMIKVIREREIFTPVIFVTGFGDTAKIRTAWQFGAFDFIDKPLKPNTLQDCVMSALDWGNTSTANIKDRAGTGKDFHRMDLFLTKEQFKILRNTCDAKNISIHTYLSQLIKTSTSK